MEEYVTVAGEAADEFIERRSRFIGAIRPAATEEDALAFIGERRAAHKEASHNVYAYLLRAGQTRCSDDGEPQGTGGVPVLDVLQKEGLTDAVVVVTRYFGGVLLGTGGLVRAYSHAAKLAAAAAGIVTMSGCSEFELLFGYELYGKISYFLPQCHAQILFSDFGAAVRLRVLLKDCHVPAFTQGLAELTAAQAVPQLVGRRYASLPDD